VSNSYQNHSYVIAKQIQPIVGGPTPSKYFTYNERKYEVAFTNVVFNERRSTFFNSAMTWKKNVCVRSHCLISDFPVSIFPNASGHYWTSSGQDRATAAHVKRNGVWQKVNRWHSDGATHRQLLPLSKFDNGLQRLHTADKAACIQGTTSVQSFIPPKSPVVSAQWLVTSDTIIVLLTYVFTYCRVGQMANSQVNGWPKAANKNPR